MDRITLIKRKKIYLFMLFFIRVFTQMTQKEVKTQAFVFTVQFYFYGLQVRIRFFRRMLDNNLGFCTDI